MRLRKRHRAPPGFLFKVLNLVSEPHQVREDWFEDESEWEQMQEEIRTVKSLQRQIDTHFNRYEQRAQRLFYDHILPMNEDREKLKEQAQRAWMLLRQPLSADRVVEFQRIVTEWKEAERRFVEHADKVLLYVRDMIETPLDDYRTRAAADVKEEVSKIAQVAARLRHREKLLLKAIGAGLYMSEPDIRMLNQKGYLSSAQFMQLLALRIGAYEGEQKESDGSRRLRRVRTSGDRLNRENAG